MMFSLKDFLFSPLTRKLSLKILWATSILFIPMLSYAQNHARLQTWEITRKGKYYSRQMATVDVQKPYRVEPEFSFTSLSLRIDSTQSFTGAYIISEEDTFLLQQDEHQPEGDSLKQANLIILDKPARHILFYPGQIQGHVIFSFLNAATGKKQGIIPQKNQRKKQQQPEGHCLEPALIEQSVWRAGLPAPDYQRISTSVKHIIIHHSAGSNTNINYVNVVRNIYLFHTMDRGWSDIGYNYLIAQDGTIFEGRSSGGQNVHRDNIQGAHFCGQNSGTMGICLLGNYSTAVPTEAALSSLIRLTAWKLDKEALDPFEIIPHPANATLGVIAAHRNGCNTECPGKNLYARLEEIRLEVKEQLTENCQPLIAVYPIPSHDILYVTVPKNITLHEILLYDTQGQNIKVPVYHEKDQWIMDTGLLTTGIYIVKVQGDNFNAEQKIILIHGS